MIVNKITINALRGIMVDKRLKSLLTIATLIAMLVITGCRSQREFSVSTFSTDEEQMTEDVLDPFGKANDLNVKGQFVSDSSRIKKSGSGDVIELSQNDAVTLNKAGKLRKLDFKRLKNFSRLSSEQQRLAKKTNSLPYSIDTLVLLYDPQKVNGIDFTSQLWDKGWVNNPAIPDISTTFGPAMVQIASIYSQYRSTSSFVGTGIAAHGKFAFEALKELEPGTKTYKTIPELNQMFKKGQIDVAVVNGSAVSKILVDNPNLKYVNPNAFDRVANYKMVSILKDSKNVDESYKYLDYRISKNVQEKVAAKDSLNEAPVNQQADVKNNRYLTDKGTSRNAVTVDFEQVNQDLPLWKREWHDIFK